MARLRVGPISGWAAMLMPSWEEEWGAVLPPAGLRGLLGTLLSFSGCSELSSQARDLRP